jgi:hypothetical protein
MSDSSQHKKAGHGWRKKPTRPEQAFKLRNRRRAARSSSSEQSRNRGQRRSQRSCVPPVSGSVHAGPSSCPGFNEHQGQAGLQLPFRFVAIEPRRVRRAKRMFLSRRGSAGGWMKALESAGMQNIDYQQPAQTCVLTSLQQPEAGWFANQLSSPEGQGTEEVRGGKVVSSAWRHHGTGAPA